MKKSESELWYATPTRQSPLAIVLLMYNLLRSIVRTWWPFIILLIVRSSWITRQTAMQAVLLVVAVLFVLATWRYLKFWFYLSDDMIHVRRGILRRTRLEIPFDRVQTIVFEQNLLHQFFNSVRLKVDTAGSSSEEFEFSALPQAKAEELRAYVLSKRAGTIKKDAADVQPQYHAADRMFALSLTDLLKVGVSQNHFRTTSIILVFLIGLRDRISQAFGDRYLDQIDAMAVGLVDNFLVYGIALFALLLIISFVGTLVYTILRFYNLTLWKGSEGYRLSSGLINRYEQGAPYHKIQMVRWVTNPLRNLFGIVTLRFHLATSQKGTKTSSILVPGMAVKYLSPVLGRFWGASGTPLDGGYGIHRAFLVRRLLFVTVVPAMAVVALSYAWGWNVGLWLAPIYAVVSGVFQFALYRRWSYHVGQHMLLTRSGALERVHKGFLLRKAQGVTVKQSPFQRRHGVVTLVLHTAAGDVTVPYLEQTRARRLKNLILYQIETSRQRWM